MFVQELDRLGIIFQESLGLVLNSVDPTYFKRFFQDLKDGAY